MTLGLLGVAAAAHATDYTFTPNPANLNNLDHYKFSSWGIDFTLPQTQTITSATLTIHNIYNWIHEDNDHLYITLLNSSQKGFHEFTDDQTPGNAWAGQGMLIKDWHDPQGGAARGFDLVVDLKAAGALDMLNSQARLNKIGLGFDADCHYFNSGAELKFSTSPVPEPATLATLGIGALGLIRRRRNRSK